jgi:RNA polymerase sigma-70 factor (ECF subfamily)
MSSSASVGGAIEPGIDRADGATRVSDRSELEALVPHVYPWAVGVAFLLCRDVQQAHDLVQDALVQAVRRPPRPLDVPTLRAWLRVVVFRLYLRHRSRARREALALLRWHGERRDHEIPDLDDAIVAALDRLSPKQRACVVLRYVEDLSEQQVADLLGLRLGTVKAHLAAGRERLRESLQPTS